FHWEMAVAAAAAALAVNPFDQPDLEASKRLARRRLRPPFPLETAGPAPGIAGRAKGTGHALVGTDPARRAAALADFLDRADGHAYVALQALLPADPPIIAAQAGLRRLIVMLLGLAITAAWGPAYLHSTGRLHKGGPG